MNMTNTPVFYTLLSRIDSVDKDSPKASSEVPASGWVSVRATTGPLLSEEALPCSACDGRGNEDRVVRGRAVLRHSGTVSFAGAAAAAAGAAGACGFFVAFSARTRGAAWLDEAFVLPSAGCAA